jgi:hypothetical protein
LESNTNEDWTDIMSVVHPRFDTSNPDAPPPCRLVTRDGRACVLVPKELAPTDAIVAERDRLGSRAHIGIVDTVEGRVVRSYSPDADAFVLSLLSAKTPTPRLMSTGEPWPIHLYDGACRPHFARCGTNVMGALVLAES